MTDTRTIRQISIIGTGVIGASWTALFLAKGLHVVATDVAPNAETALRKFVQAAWPALERLSDLPVECHRSGGDRRGSAVAASAPDESYVG